MTFVPILQDIFGVSCLLMMLLLAWVSRPYLQILSDFQDITKVAPSLAIVQYLTAWLAFACYLAFGMGPVSFSVVMAALVALNVLFLKKKAAGRAPIVPQRGSPGHTSTPERTATARRRILRSIFMAAFAVLFCMPFVTGLIFGQDGTVYYRLNLLDTPYHLSVARTFLVHPHFPPMDLEMAGYPLNYHFLADFFAAFLSVQGAHLLSVMYLLNVLHAAVLAVVLWGCVEWWLDKPHPAITGMSCAFFAFVIPFSVGAARAILGGWFHQPAAEWGAHLLDQRDYFEYSLYYMFEPQRALLFSFPVVLLILYSLSVLWRRYDGKRTKETLWLLCLLPFAHAPSFLEAGACAFLVAVKNRVYLRQEHWRAAALPLAVLALQLYYLKGFLPPSTAGYSGWDAWRWMSWRELAPLAPVPRWIFFWLRADGEFLVLGALGGLLMVLGTHRGRRKELWRSAFVAFLGIFFAFFVLINVYRFSRNTGDSNKFVLLLNFWLSLLAAKGLDRLRSKNRAAGNVLVGAVAAFAILPYGVDTVLRLRTPPSMLFTRADQEAADWIRTHTTPEDYLVTCPTSVIHFVGPLAGRTVLHGIYSDTHPYFSFALTQDIRSLYENADFSLLRDYPVRWIVVSGHERAAYQLSPVFSGTPGLVFSSSDDKTAPTRIYDAGVFRRAAGRGP